MPKIHRESARDLVLLSFVMYADRSVIELKRYADNIINPKLERLNGVGHVQISGGETKHVLVEVSQNRLEAYGLTLSAIASFISSHNFELSVGSLLDNNLRYQAQVSGEFNSIKDLEDVVISYNTPNNLI
ncbi:efflux RND transporter permease subunit [Borrelia miyamotoi]|uniref:efflux RND transporter permease subunit n=1 Tax=Borrelia miyamotoi TaxID=47466 RepID=UPI00240DC4AD|nr:efflux RND transporter permease subunit [Borrelia miyamotoi]